jgi:hypothetical protein
VRFAAEAEEKRAAAEAVGKAAVECWVAEAEKEH